MPSFKQLKEFEKLQVSKFNKGESFSTAGCGSLVRCWKYPRGSIWICTCWWFRNPAVAPVEVCKYPHYFQVFIHVRWLFGISEPHQQYFLKSFCKKCCFNRLFHGQSLWLLRLILPRLLHQPSHLAMADTWEVTYPGNPPGNGWSMGPTKREGKGKSSTQVPADWDGICDRSQEGEWWWWILLPVNWFSTIFRHQHWCH